MVVAFNYMLMILWYTLLIEILLLLKAPCRQIWISLRIGSTILYCSMPVVKISETMVQKFETLQDKILKIIYHRIKESRENDITSISNHKKLKAACLIFKCLHGTSIPAFLSYAEKINHTYTLRLPLLRTEAAKQSFLFQGSQCFNEQPLEIRSLNSIVLYKTRAKKFYI